MKLVCYATFQACRDQFREIPWRDIRKHVATDEEYRVLNAEGDRWLGSKHLYAADGKFISTTPISTRPAFYKNDGSLWFVGGRSEDRLYAAGVGLVELE